MLYRIKNNFFLVGCCIFLFVGTHVSFAKGIFDFNKKFEPTNSDSRNKAGLKNSFGYRSFYRTGLGLSGLTNLGISYKQFIDKENAIESVLVSRWHGVSLTCIYEKCIFGDGASRFVCNFGGGPRFGFYDGKYFKSRFGGENERESRTYSVFGLTGNIGVEYCFPMFPVSASIDFRPFFDLTGREEGLVNFAYTLKYVF